MTKRMLCRVVAAMMGYLRSSRWRKSTKLSICEPLNLEPHLFFLNASQIIDRVPFLFKHDHLKMKVTVTWKCFDGIQLTAILKSDARNEFGFQSSNAFFQMQFLIFKSFCIFWNCESNH